MLRLYPRWHGSQRQGQATLHEISTAAKAAKVSPKIFTLSEGEMLYLPPLWLHSVESLSPSVAANFWTHSLFSDTWSLLSNVTGGDEDGEGDRPEADRFRGLFAGYVEGPATMLAAAQVILTHLFQMLPRAQSGDNTLSSVARNLVLARYSKPNIGPSGAPVGGREDAKETLPATRWDARAASSEAADLAEERRAFIETCVRACAPKEQARIKIRQSQRDTLRAFAEALGALPDGPRSLLLEEWVDELSGWVVSQAGLKFWEAHVGVFVSKCLYREGVG